MLIVVAPHTGAWIETAVCAGAADVVSSHPTRVRGLKQSNAGYDTRRPVAPHTGAWIETY